MDGSKLQEMEAARLREMAATSRHPVDRHVGLQVRLLRKARGYGQERLGRGVGLTFQQIQKYESGRNRISASKLWEIARFLRLPVSAFFEGLDPESGSDALETEIGALQRFLLTPEALELATSFRRIQDAQLRRRTLDLVRAAADVEEARQRTREAATPAE